MKPRVRYDSIDAYRGLIMILMAIDHASAMIARQHASEFWAGAMSAYDSAFPFLTRWVTHLCAPGFFFLMGAGIYWYAASRRDADGPSADAASSRWTLMRGLALFGIAQLFEVPVMIALEKLPPAAVSLNKVTAPPPIDGTTMYWGFITLSGLAMVMMVCALLLRLRRPWMWLVVSALCVIVTNTMLPADGKPGPLWATILLTAGLSQHVIVIYPVIPWLGVAAAGMYFGWWWRSNPSRTGKQVWLVGAVMVGVAVVLRAIGGWGNIRAPRDSGWIEFLNNVKYPPSLVFWLMSVGLGLLLVALLAKLPDRVRSEHSPMIVFGQTPLFFYLAHFLLLTVCGFVFFQKAASLEGAYVVWALAVIALYPVCLRYRTFKMGKPRESLWRLF